MTPEGPLLSAGWYADPESPGERWWNGSQWTAHTRPGVDGAQRPDREGQPPTAWSDVDPELVTVTPSAHEAGVGRLTKVQEFAPIAPAPPVPLAIAPGWYPDPAGLPANRWWDGQGWTAHQAPVAGYPPYPGPGYHPYGTTVVVNSPPKSVGVAFVLTFFFGPLGMLYSTVIGAVVMLGTSIVGAMVVGLLTFGLGLFLWWPAIWITSIIWGCLAVSNQPVVPAVTTYYR